MSMWLTADHFRAAYRSPASHLIQLILTCFHNAHGIYLNLNAFTTFLRAFTVSLWLAVWTSVWTPYSFETAKVSLRAPSCELTSGIIERVLSEQIAVRKSHSALQISVHLMPFASKFEAQTVPHCQGDVRTQKVLHSERR